MLKPVLLANAASCAIFGTIFIASGPQTSDFLGNPPVSLLVMLGVGLWVNTALLIAAALGQTTSRAKILLFVTGDAIWVLVTVVLCLFGIWITTAAGLFAAAAVAIYVGSCGWLQWKYLPAISAET